jgi:hypothetical protein
MHTIARPALAFMFQVAQVEAVKQDPAHLTPADAAQAMQAAEEVNGESVRRILQACPDFPVQAHPLVAVAYSLALLQRLSSCGHTCWAHCRTYAAKLLAMMRLPAPDGPQFVDRAVEFLFQVQTQLEGQEVTPLDARDPGDEDTAEDVDAATEAMRQDFNARTDAREEAADQELDRRKDAALDR